MRDCRTFIWSMHGSRSESWNKKSVSSNSVAWISFCGRDSSKPLIGLTVDRNTLSIVFVTLYSRGILNQLLRSSRDGLTLHVVIGSRTHLQKEFSNGVFTVVILWSSEFSSPIAIVVIGDTFSERLPFSCFACSDLNPYSSRDFRSCFALVSHMKEVPVK